MRLLIDVGSCFMMLGGWFECLSSGVTRALIGGGGGGGVYIHIFVFCPTDFF